MSRVVKLKTVAIIYKINTENKCICNTNFDAVNNTQYSKSFWRLPFGILHAASFKIKEYRF